MEGNIQSAEVVLLCASLDETVQFFKDRPGFRVDMISPADDPREVAMSGYGIHLRLQRTTDQSVQSSATIRLLLKDESTTDTHDITELLAPNGTKVQLVKNPSALAIPPINPSFVVTRMRDNAQWIKGRAGMHYRDLIPGRQGGRFIASHIRIDEGGPVNDHVHYHQIRFQFIYVYKGWVRLVYEDQGPPFVLHAGQCVLQPPLIRHRVLESSPGLEVIEIACPAVHDTYIDHLTQLPTDTHQPERDFSGQRFVTTSTSEEQSEWRPWRLPGFEYHDTGIGTATQNLGTVRIVRTNDDDVSPQLCQHDAEFVFLFVLTGQLSLQANGQTMEKLIDGDAFVLPAHQSYAFTYASPDLRLLEVSLPAAISTFSPSIDMHADTQQ